VGSGAMPALEPVGPESPVERLLDAYGRHLVTERGIKTTTIAGYRSAVRGFLEQRVHGERLELGGLKAADVTRFVLRACDGHAAGSAKHLVGALRSLLRYLHLVGKAPDLAAAVPAVAGWRGGQLPRGLETQQVTRMLAACERDTVAGRR